jgi:creatinine amidohydrolase
MHKETVFLGELTRKELGDAIGNGTVKAAIVPTGATEQHQDHLAMIHDTVSVTEISRRVAMRFYPHVLVTPTIAMSVSEHHMSRGGALTVRPEIHAEHVYDICHSLKRLGVSRVMVVNGHGGNMLKNLEPKAPECVQRIRDLGVEYVTYWKTIPDAFFEAHLESDRSAGHAGEFETSFAMVAFPERIRAGSVNYDSAQLATIAKGGLIMEAAVEGVAGEMQKLLDRQ